MKTKLKFVVSFLLILSLSRITPSVAYEDCNAIYVNGEESQTPGKCTTFPECPILFDILKSPYKTHSEIKLLQKLTCKPDNVSPTICCAFDDIVSETSNYAPKPAIAPPENEPNDGIVFEPPKKNKPKPQTEDHPNFKMLPTLSECGSSVGSDRILGGKNGTILDYPWLARIGYYSHEEDTIKYLCAGTVINKRYILTAAHCTQEINPDEFEPVEIRLGQPDQECDDTYGCSNPVDIKIEKIIPHPNYNKRDKSNDIGLIRLAEDIPYVKNVFICPICLPFVEEYGLKLEEVNPSLEKYIDNGKKSAVVAGWGKTQWNNQEGSSQLQYVHLPVISQRQCQKSYQSHARVIITEKQICAGGEKGEDSCGGDSGGGLFIPLGVSTTSKTKRTLTFQFGVVSFGPVHCGIGGLPGVYSNIYAYKEWILDQLQP